MVQDRDGGKKAVVGRAPAQHVELLTGQHADPDSRADGHRPHESPVYNEGNRRGVFYAQSWALVHYLSFGNPARAKQFSQYLSSVRSGSEPQAAFTASVRRRRRDARSRAVRVSAAASLPRDHVRLRREGGRHTVPAGSRSTRSTPTSTSPTSRAGSGVTRRRARAWRPSSRRSRRREGDHVAGAAAVPRQQLDKALPLLEQAAAQGSPTAGSRWPTGAR